jgi:hypothetical protein
MSRRTTGALLILVSSVLYSTRYLAAAIFGSSLQNWSTDLFNAMLRHVGQGLVAWSLIALVAGLSYLVWAEFEAKQTHPHS